MRKIKVLLAMVFFGALGCQTTKTGMNSDIVSYDCKKDYFIHSLEMDDPEKEIKLVINGKERALYRVKSASGVKFATEVGLWEDSGLIWWNKGSEYSLYKMSLDHTSSPEDNVLLTTCALAKVLSTG